MLYGMSEHLMIMHEVQKARLADLARKAGTQPGERHGVIRHDEYVRKVRAHRGAMSKSSKP